MPQKVVVCPTIYKCRLAVFVKTNKNSKGTQTAYSKTRITQPQYRNYTTILQNILELVDNYIYTFTIIKYLNTFVVCKQSHKLISFKKPLYWQKNKILIFFVARNWSTFETSFVRITHHDFKNPYVCTIFLNL